MKVEKEKTWIITLKQFEANNLKIILETARIDYNESVSHTRKELIKALK